MLNEEKIKIMNKLAMYEQGEGKKYLPVSGTTVVIISDLP